MSLEKVIQYANERKISKNSRILNVTHVDLDGIVSTINLKNHFNEVFFVQKNYDKINEYFKDVIFANRCTFKNPDFIIVTDISLTEEVVEECEERGINLLILDHHETAYNLNKYDNVYVDEGEELSGAGVTLEFIKGIGFESNKLDKLNDIANQFDLFLFKQRPELRKFKISGKPRSLAEMLNTLYFKSNFDKEDFIGRWLYGWGSGFTSFEVQMIKDEEKLAKENLEKILDNPGIEVQLDEDKVLILNNQFIVYTGEHYLDFLDKQMVIFYNPERMKFSGRVNDKSNINIGKIFQTLAKKFDFVGNGGGHEKAGGGNLLSNDHLEKFIESVVKLAQYYSKEKK
jgi:oligoribonuclease NrnB/cAMP/cGMP phosphodiesterase (DHH superfamily)